MVKNIPDKIEIFAEDTKNGVIVFVRFCSLYNRWHKYKIKKYVENNNKIRMILEK